MVNKITPNIILDAKMSDLIVAYPNIITIFERLNIPFGFGDKKVEEVAVDNQIDALAFISIIQLFSGKHYDDTTLKKESIGDILFFLKSSHQYFKERQIPEIKESIKLFSETIQPKHGSMIISFFDGYIQEMNEHFLYEEETVFPYIESIINESFQNGFEINEFEKNHTDIEQKLLDLKHILIKYIPEKHLSPYRLEILKKLNILEEDIYYHSYVEDSLLVPSVKRIEKTTKKLK